MNHLLLTLQKKVLEKMLQKKITQTQIFLKGLEEAIELLIEKGADVNVSNKNKNTALILTAENGKNAKF